MDASIRFLPLKFSNEDRSGGVAEVEGVDSLGDPCEGVAVLSGGEGVTVLAGVCGCGAGGLREGEVVDGTPFEFALPGGVDGLLFPNTKGSDSDVGYVMEFKNREGYGEYTRGVIVNKVGDDLFATGCEARGVVASFDGCSEVLESGGVENGGSEV